MKKIFLIITIVTCLLSCNTDESGARKTLEKSGYTNIVIGGYRFNGGSKDDFYVTEFTATAPNGEKCSGCVTKGYWGKGSTIRLDD